MDWLEHVTAQVAGAAGLEGSALALSLDDQRELLEVARIAAHTSGDRTNAPLLCYVLGLARSAGASLSDLGRAVREAAEQ